MAAFTSSGSGNWSSTSTWGGSGPPGSGDTATIASGHVVTCTSNVTIGTSGVNGTVAITIGGVTSQVVVNSGVVLQLHGDFLVLAGFQGAAFPQLLLNAGGILEFDSSAAASPSTTKYQMKPSAANYSGFFTANGTSGNRCKVRSNAGGANGYFGDGGFTQGGSMQCFYTDFLNIGDASNPGFSPHLGSYISAVWDIERCTFTGCGVITNGGITDAHNPVIKHLNNLHLASASGNTMMFSFSGAMGTGPRNFIGNYFDGAFGFDGASTASPWNCTITDNFFYVPPQFGGANLWASFVRCLVRTADGTSMIAEGDLTDSYFCYDAVTPVHCHMPDIGPGPTTINILRNIWDSTWLASNTNSADGIVEDVGGADTLVSETVANNLVIPAGDGYGSSTLLDMWAIFHTQYLISHNTVAAAFAVLGCVGGEYETSTGGNSDRGFLKNNIFWSGIVPTTLKPLYAAHVGSENPLVDWFAPTTVLNNARFNLTLTDPAEGYANQGNSYIGAWSVTPGGSDVVANPNFLDPTRNAARFDTAYLKNVASATWASQLTSHTFAIGDVISDANSNYYAGALINYRCILSHTKSTANSEPGTGSAWHTYWELNTWNSIRVGDFAGTLITDASIGVTAASYKVTLMAWVRAGYAPTNTALKGAGSDGLDIGAVAWQAAPAPPPSTGHGINWAFAPQVGFPALG